MEISSLERVEQVDRNGLATTNFDMEILTSMTNTDLLIRLIKEQNEETAALKSQLSSFNASAMQMKNCYTAEKKKNDQIEGENRQLQLRIKSLEEKILLLNNNLLNNTVLHEQRVAEIENQLEDKAAICRQLITQWNILKENSLSSRDLHQQCNNAREFLRKRGEVVEDVKICAKKKKPTKVNAATMTDQCDKVERKVVKTFCDKSTMHCPMVSTATRGTTTSAFIKKVDVATNFPEPIDIEVDEIFRIMIDDMPPAITPIDSFPLQTKYCQTEPASQQSCSVGTITRLRNVRRKINYASEPSQLSPTSNHLYRVKKEKEDSMSDLSNLGCPNQGEGHSPINQKLTHLWQIVGQMIFSIIGNGDVFSHQSNMTLINDNLNQIRRVIEMESQPEAQFHSMDEIVDDDFNIATDLSGFGAVDTSPNDSSLTSNSGNLRSSPSTPYLPHVERSTNRKQNKSPRLRQAECTTTTINEDYSNDMPCTTNSTVACETESVFKKPAPGTSGTKRKRITGITEDCTIRKRTCRTKMISKANVIQLDEPEPEDQIRNANDFVSPIDRLDQSTPAIEDPDSALVEHILRYYTMPKFIVPITDSDVVIEAYHRLSRMDECPANSSVDLEMISNTLASSDLASRELVTYDELESSTSPPPFNYSDRLPASRDMEIYDEYESPASPPPCADSASPYQAAVIIPTSPKKVKSSAVKNILASFDSRKRLALCHRKSKVPTIVEEQILTSTRHRIEQYVMSEWIENEIDACCSELSNIRPSILSKCIIEVVMNTGYERLSGDFTPPAPALPKTHRKIVVLIKRIGRHLNGFEDLVLFQLEKSMFVLAGDKVSIAEGLNLTHLFIGLTDCQAEESKWSCVMFVYKCLYYFAIKATPMIYSVLMAYPTILPKFQEGEDVHSFLMNTANILQATFVAVLINTNLFEPDSVIPNKLMKKELGAHLKRYYQFPYMKPSINEFVDILVKRLTNSSNLDNISHSLALIAKRNGVAWADDMVRQKLLPLLNNFLTTVSDGDENDERITVLLSAISSIIKAFPITKEISNYLQMFFKILDLTTRQTIQEEAVMALLRSSRFGMVDVYKRICDWEPQFEVSRQCYAMLSTFLYRQNLSYWKQI